MPAEGQQQELQTRTESLVPASLLDRIVEEGRLGQSEAERRQGREWVQAFLDDIMKSQAVVSKDLEHLLSERIAQLDAILSDQLNEIVHAPEFQSLEASWRGLHYLVDQTETSTSLKIKVMNVARRELLKDLKSASEFDQSEMFKKVYEEEYGTLGGAPFGALVGDYYFGRGPEDLEILEKMSNIAAAAHAPFITAPSPELFGWSSFTDLSGPRDLAKIFDNELFARWKSFRESEDSRYVGLVMPHILLRLPYGTDSITVEDFNYEEEVDGSDHKKYLWGNAAYAFAARLTNAFAQYEWCAAIRGVEGGGLVEGLPTHTFKTDDGDIALKCPTEIRITDRREFELSKLGFIPLCHHKGSDRAVFFGAQSAQKPTQYLEDDANANARLSAQLPYIMAISRFAHFLKAIMRDKIGSFTSQEKLQTDLNNWIAHYVLLDDSAPQEHKAKFPLREARIEVSEQPGKPGAYTAVAYLRPHFQLDEMNISLRLVAKLPAPKG
ncbi:MAG: type VI secretion system contractile sheath large subunit [Acidobacteriia bacterium]|nr:type VI secretion system contractile sheath large subunit [Terriglobia bacterium]